MERAANTTNKMPTDFALFKRREKKERRKKEKKRKKERKKERKKRKDNEERRKEEASFSRNETQAAFCSAFHGRRKSRFGLYRN